MKSTNNKRKNYFYYLHVSNILYYVITTSSSTNTADALSIFSRKPKILKLSDEIGASSIFGFQNNKGYFDPFNFANELNFAKYRECELKHGRVAMFATIGMILPDILYNDNNIIIQKLKEIYISPSHNLKFDDIPPSSVKALEAIPWEGWTQILLFVGMLETQIFIQRNKNDMPGDYSFGYFGLRDKGRHENLLIGELDNGRIAMIAFIAQVTFELVTGMTVLDGWRNLISQ